MNEDRIKCKLCNEEFRSLWGHLRRIHNIDTFEYRRMFPDAPTTAVEEMLHRGPLSEETKQKIGDANGGRMHTEEAKRAMSIAHTGMKLSEETIQKLSEANKGRVFDEEFCRSVSKGKMGHTVSEETRQKISQALMGRTSSEETKQKISQSLMGNTNTAGHKHSEEVKQKISQSLVGRNLGHEHDEETRKKISKGCLAAMTDDRRRRMSEALMGNQYALGHTFVMSEETKREISEGNMGKVHSPESIKQMSEARKELWKDPEYARSVFEAINRRPNFPELQLQSVLDKYFSGKWKYVGDGKDKEGWIGGKNPDFMSVNGEKQLIELFGLFWHDPDIFPNRPTEEELIAHYKSFGFDCLVIWEYDVWDEEIVMEKVKGFTAVVPK